MVSADNMNLDCLELIFAFLSGTDLVSVSLVSRSFLAGVIPHLYRDLVFHLGHAKRYARVASPFAAIRTHPNLAVHVRKIDIRTIPCVRSVPHPKFMNDVINAITSCKNLSSFTLTNNALPSFLLALQSHERLDSMRINANLTTVQARKLVSITGLRDLTLDAATWNVIDVLPQWTGSLASTLASLTLYSLLHLNETILEAILPQLPMLTGLHVIDCAAIEHTMTLRLVKHTPLLESLAITCWERPRALPPHLPSLRSLRHLAVDTRDSGAPNGVANLLVSIITLTKTWGCSLTSITFKVSHPFPMPSHVTKELYEAHGTTLRHISFPNSGLDGLALRWIGKCLSLETLACTISLESVSSFCALADLEHLHTLIDIGDAHTKHGALPVLTKSQVWDLLNEVLSAKTLVVRDRIWTAEKEGDWENEGFRLLPPERRRDPFPRHAFLAPIF